MGNGRAEPCGGTALVASHVADPAAATKEIPAPAAPSPANAPSPVVVQVQALEPSPSAPPAIASPVVSQDPASTGALSAAPASAPLPTASLPVDPEKLSPAAGTKLILAKSMAARKEQFKAKAIEKSIPQEPLPTPSRSETPPPRVTMPEPSKPLGPLVGSETEVAALAEKLTDDDEAADDTQHYSYEFSFKSGSENEVNEPATEQSDGEGEVPQSPGSPFDDEEDPEWDPTPIALLESKFVESLDTANGEEGVRRGAWVAEEEVARRFGRPAWWGQEAAHFLSPDAQQAPKPRGRKASKAKGKKGKKGKKVSAKKSKRAKATVVEDEDCLGFDATEPEHSEQASSSKMAVEIETSEPARSGRASSRKRAVELEASEPARTGRASSRKRAVELEISEPGRTGRASSRKRAVELEISEPAYTERASSRKRAGEIETSEPAHTGRASSRKRAASKEGDVVAPKRSKKASPKVAPSPAPEPENATKAKSAPKSKPSPKAKRGPKKTSPKSKPAACKSTEEYKTRMSRKSGAYHAALKLARSQGKTEEDCRLCARQAT